MLAGINFKSGRSIFLGSGLLSKHFSAAVLITGFTIYAAFLTFLAVTVAEANANAEPVAAITSISGDFERRQSGADIYAVVKHSEAASMKLYDRDALRTPESVTGTVETVYGATIELKEKTEIEFGIFNVRIKKGDMWINYKHRGDSAAGNNFKVHTPAGTIGIKGTAFRTAVSEKSGEVRIFVTNGAVQFTNKAGAVKIIEAGFNLSIDSDGNFAEPVKNEEAGQNNGAAPDSAPDSGNAGKNGENDKSGQSGQSGGNDITGASSGGETGIGANSEVKKPLQIEDGGAVNTETNPFE